MAKAKPEQLEAIRQYQDARPTVKCAVDGCPYCRQDAWDAIKYTPAPDNWKCSVHTLHEAAEI